MRYCKNCGAEVYDDQDVCLKCGFLLREPQYQKANDSGSFGWGVLGFCFPIVGLILYLVWKEQKPLSAKMAGVGALISFIINVIIGIIYAIVIIGLMQSGY